VGRIAGWGKEILWGEKAHVKRREKKRVLKSREQTYKSQEREGEAEKLGGGKMCPHKNGGLEKRRSFRKGHPTTTLHAHEGRVRRRKGRNIAGKFSV